MIEIIVALIGAATTIFTIVWQSRKTNQQLDEHKTTSARNDAKQSILQMMVEDKVDYHLNHKLTLAQPVAVQLTVRFVNHNLNL